jgi:hypothetical protein
MSNSDYENYLVRDYRIIKTFNSFNKLDLKDKLFFYNKSKQLYENNFKNLNEEEKKFLDKTIDFFLFDDYYLSGEEKNGFKSFLTAKRLLDKGYEFSFETNSQSFLVSKENSYIYFETGNSQYKIKDDFSDLLNFFIARKIVIKKIFVEHKNKKVLTIYDVDIGLCIFDNIELYCYEKNKTGISIDDKNYSECIKLKFNQSFPYKMIDYTDCDGKYCDKVSPLPYYINDGYKHYSNYHVLSDCSIIASKKDGVTILDGNYIIQGVFFVSYNEKYIYHLDYHEIVKYDREKFISSDFFYTKEFKMIRKFHISENELFLCISCKNYYMLLNRDSQDSEFKFFKKVKYDHSKKEEAHFTSNKKYFVICVLNTETSKLYVYDIKTKEYKKILLDGCIDYDHIFTMKIKDNKIKICTENLIYEILIANKIVDGKILDDYNHDQLIGVDNYFRDIFRMYYSDDTIVTDNLQERSEDYKLTEYELEQINDNLDERGIEPTLENIEIERTILINEWNRFVKIKNEVEDMIVKERNKILFNERVLFVENNTFSENKIYIRKNIDIFKFLGLRPIRPIFFEISNNCDLILVGFDSVKLKTEKAGEFFRQRKVPYTDTEITIFLIDKNYNVYLLEDLEEKIGGVYKKCQVTFSPDNNALFFIHQHDVYIYEIRNINNKYAMRKTYKEFDAKLSKNSLFDKNLLGLISDF